MARTTQTPGKPKAKPEEEKTEQTIGEDQADPTPLLEQPEPLSGGVDIQEQLDRIEQNQADIMVKLDALIEAGGVKVVKKKRWVDDPKLGHILKEVG